MKKWIVCILVMSYAAGANSQDLKRDSLFTVLLTHKISEDNLDAIIGELNLASMRTDFESNIKKYYEIKNLSTFKSLHPKLKIHIYDRIIKLKERADCEETINYARKAIALSYEIKFYKKVIELERVIGICHFESGSMENAITQFDLCDQLIENYNLPEGYKQITLGGRAAMMMHFGLIDEGIKLHHEVIDLIGTEGARATKLFTSIYLLQDLIKAGAYEEFAENYHLFDEAKNEGRYTLSESHYPIQAMFNDDNSPETLQKLEQFLESLSQSKSANFDILHTAASTFFKKLSCEEFYKIEPYLKQLERRISEVKHAPSECSTYDMISQLKACDKNYEDAFKYQQKSHDCMMKIKDGRLNDQLLEYQVQYESEKKEKEIAKQQLTIEHDKKKRNLLIALAIFGFMASTFILFYYRQRMARQVEEQRIELLTTEKQAKVDKIQAMLNGQESERKRIAKELHDGLGAILTTAKRTHQLSQQIKTSEKEKLSEKVVDLLDKAYEETRRISHNMLPTMLDLSGFENSIRDLISNKRTNGLDVEFETKGDLNKINTETAKNIFRITQELFQNVIKHAEANQVLLQIIVNPHSINYLFEDNGKGFDPHTETKDGIGLMNIKNRVAYLQGTFSIDSVVKSGTTITIEIPIQHG